MIVEVSVRTGTGDTVTVEVEVLEMPTRPSYGREWADAEPGQCAEWEFHSTPWSDDEQKLAPELCEDAVFCALVGRELDLKLEGVR